MKCPLDYPWTRLWVVQENRIGQSMEYLVLNVRQPELADDARTDAEIATAGIGARKATILDLF